MVPAKVRVHVPLRFLPSLENNLRGADSLESDKILKGDNHLEGDDNIERLRAAHR